MTELYNINSLRIENCNNKSYTIKICNISVDKELKIRSVSPISHLHDIQGRGNYDELLVANCNGIECVGWVNFCIARNNLTTAARTQPKRV